MPTTTRRRCVHFGLASTLLAIVAVGANILSTIGPLTPAAFGGQKRAESWTITFNYGGGTPGDSRPMGHCTVTLNGDGRARITAQRIWIREKPQVVLYENDALSPRLVQVLSKAANAALQEKPFVWRGSNEDGDFYRLDRTGADQARVHHNQMRTFSDAPPAMRKFAALINGLLPANERWPRAPKRGAAENDKLDTKVASPPEWTVILQLGRQNAAGEWQATHEGRFSANGSAKITAADTVLYEHNEFVAEDLAIFQAAAKQACKEQPRDGGVDQGLFVRVEILDRDGWTVDEHRDVRLHRYSDASPGTATAVHWMNDHLPKTNRVD